MKSTAPTRFYDGKRYEISASTGYLLSQLMQLMRREVEQRMARLDLTDAQWKPLWLLHLGRADTPLEMARELDMDAGALSRLLERLVAKGLIERERSEVDRRVVHLRLTSEGAAVAAQVPNVLATVNNDFLQGMDKAEWQQLMTLLAHMIANGQALQSEGAAA
jgi:DNA-binding MarR family transcriptional regulator